MINRETMLADAEALMCDAADMQRRIAATRPESLPLVQQVIDDTARAYWLIESSRLGAGELTEIAARLTRALLLSEALRGDVQ